MNETNIGFWWDVVSNLHPDQSKDWQIDKAAKLAGCGRDAVVEYLAERAEVVG